MELTWNAADLAKLLADANTHWRNGFKKTWSGEGENRPGFWLVGDHGVYIMHNGNCPDGHKQPVAYAVECNPDKLPFDQWWANKGASFGGDDGCDFFDGAETIRNVVERGGTLTVKFSRESFEVIGEWPTADEPKQAGRA